MHEKKGKKPTSFNRLKLASTELPVKDNLTATEMSHCSWLEFNISIVMIKIK